MASGNMKDIKRRVKSVESTMQITKAMEQGLTFAIREGGRTVGSGRVATVIE